MTPVVAYVRVSTEEQAERGLSLPEQRRALEDLCRTRGWRLVNVYEDAGVTGRTENRPEFQRLLRDAQAKPRSFDKIVVYAWHRLFRSVYLSLKHAGIFEGMGIEVVSMTENFGNGAAGRFGRTNAMAAHEFISDMNGENALRGMTENMRQGFMNGLPPFGFRSIAVEQRGDKTKKRLEIDRREAETVRLIFRLYLEGDGARGPMGVKTVMEELHRRGVRQRSGKPFSTQYVHDILKNTAYVGNYVWNKRDSKTGRQKPESEWITAPCPAVVDRKTFDAVQSKLHRDNPKVRPPRQVNSPILLSGLIKCAHCGSAMTRGGGVSKTGKRHVYYTCSARNRKGKLACKGQWIAMPKVDDSVTAALTERVLTPEHVKNLMREVQAIQGKGQERNADARGAIERETRKLQGEIGNLLSAVAAGKIEQDDFTRSEIGRRKAALDDLDRRKGQLARASKISFRGLTNQKIGAATIALGSMLRDGPLKFRQAFMQLFLSRVDCEDGEIRMSGSKQALAAAVANAEKLKSAGVLAFVQEWRPRRDLNARPPD